MKANILFLSLLFVLGCKVRASGLLIDRGDEYANPAVGALVAHSAMQGRPEHNIPPNYEMDLLCTATLLCPNMVATAEHCIERESPKNKKEKYINFSGLQKYGFVNTSPLVKTAKKLLPAELKSIVESFVPPKLKLPEGEALKVDNVVLLRLEDGANDFFSNIRFPKIPRVSEIKTLIESGASSKIAGFGGYFDRTETPPVLKSGKLSAMPVALEDGVGSLQKHFLKSFDQDKRGRNVCRGDSGGPLFLSFEGQDWLAGVTSSYSYSRLENVKQILRIGMNAAWRRSVKGEFEKFNSTCGSKSVSHPNYSAATAIRHAWIQKKLDQHCPASSEF